ncbi:alpha-ketoacid dehydrogenase subunit beta [Actinoplanes xinjiangensis]|uniref:Pyruvate dehydrogenase E1 component beta subunit n=1 Tax=Actinoplanes xinjiangensis TaxID=512350 RepID=A0A316EUU4_9ACTN|nr:transketolase C-terminal domain-containing protein [Actinoplanes xinjiangensis]PWK36091.1 pyruvate dehydrogenase E1 component beta subunit [Actinoplanes xinjiangensis]GIF42905.1 pyruvate dehydrogenase E1 component subunit beta [Actinoplanes xinjiangensis]
MNEVGLLDVVVQEEFDRDPTLVFLATNSPAALRGRFGADRVRICAISEQAMVGMGVGAAMSGLRPIVDLNRASFGLLTMDQLVNHAGRMHYQSGGGYRVPMVVTAATRGRQQLGPQNEQCTYGLFMQTPGLTVVVPGSLAEACGLLRTAVRWPGPVLYFVAPELNRQRGLSAALGTPPLPFGVAALLRRGDAATIVAIGGAVPVALAAAESLSNAGTDCDVLDPRTLAPLDVPAIADSVARTGRLIVVDDGPRSGAPVQILGRLAERPDALAALGGRVGFVCQPDVPVPSSPALEDLTWPTEQRIVDEVRRLLDADG